MGDIAPRDYPTNILAALLTITPWQADSVAYVGIAPDAPFTPDDGGLLVDESGMWISLIA